MAYNSLLPPGLVSPASWKAAQFQWQPTLTAHDPNPPMFLEDGGISRSANNLLVLSQEVSYVLKEPEEASNVLVISQSVQVQVADLIQLSQSITFSQQASAFIPNQHGENTLVISQSVDCDTVLNRSVSDTFVIFQVVEVTKITKAQNTITFTDEAVAEKRKGALDTLTFTQSATVQLTPHFDFASNVIEFEGTVNCDAVYPRSVSSTLTFVQQATAQRIKSRSVSNLFVVSHNATNAVILQPNNTITFSNTATQFRVINRSVGNVLAFSDSVNVNTVLLRSLTDIFPVIQGFIRPTDIDGNFELITVPPVMVTKVNAAFVLETATKSIILPKPLFGDGEGGLGKLIVHRTRGKTFTYTRKTTSRKLTYKFSLTRDKAYELREYLLDFLATPTKLTNWKGEVWYGYVMNNPYTLTARQRAAPCTEFYDAELEFEGVRIH